MRSVTALPEGYREYARIDLQKDKRTALRVNLIAGAAMIALFALGHFLFVPITELFSFRDGMGAYWLRLVALMAGYVVYMVLHELTHAAAMKLLGGQQVRFGFTGLYAYAGSLVDYFDKTAYRLIALAPLVVWGIVFTVLLCLVQVSWFWPVYFLQVGNIAGAMGDVYVTVKCWGMPSDILVRDTGVEMTVFSKETAR